VFNVLDEASKASLKEILENAPAGSMVAEFYASGLDTARIEAEGLAPIKDLLDSIDSIATLSDAWKVVAALHKEQFCHPFFMFGASPDAKKSSWVAAQLAQAGLGLPDRDYYGIFD
jgi:putative endopeptidase